MTMGYTSSDYTETYLSQSEEKNESFDFSDIKKETTIPQSKKGVESSKSASGERNIDAPSLKRVMSHLRLMRVRMILQLHLLLG